MNYILIKEIDCDIFLGHSRKGSRLHNSPMFNDINTAHRQLEIENGLFKTSDQCNCIAKVQVVENDYI